MGFCTSQGEKKVISMRGNKKGKMGKMCKRKGLAERKARFMRDSKSGSKKGKMCKEKEWHRVGLDKSDRKKS